MYEDRPKDYNIAWNIIGELFVSTATWHTIIMASNGWCKTFETIVWTFDPNTRSRGKILKHINHKSEKEASKFHARYCAILQSRLAPQSPQE